MNILGWLNLFFCFFNLSAGITQNDNKSLIFAGLNAVTALICFNLVPSPKEDNKDDNG